MSRRSQRIDYKGLNSTGEVTPINTSNLSEQLGNITLEDEYKVPSNNDIKIDIAVLIRDIRDLIDEDPYPSQPSITKLEDLRSALRRKGIILSASETDTKIQDDINNTLSIIKEYIKVSRDKTSKIRLREDKLKQDEITQRHRSTIFLIDNISRALEELNEDLKRNPNHATNEELIKWSSDMPLLSTKLDKVAGDYKTILELPITVTDQSVKIKSIGEKYESLVGIKRDFVKTLNNEICIREMGKDQQFNQSMLNIKLEKFIGYDSNIDYYTFRSHFK